MVVTLKSPLWGKKVVVTRTRSLGCSFNTRLQQLGAVPLSIPSLDITSTASLAEGLLGNDLAWCDWILLPSPSVVSEWARMIPLLASNELNQQVAVLGSPSAKACQRFLGKEPNFVYDWNIGGPLADQMELEPFTNFLILGSDQGPGPILAELLGQHSSCRLRQIIQVSCSSSLAEDMAILSEGFDAIAFTSSSGVHCFMPEFLPLLQDGKVADETCFACIGPSTAAALGEWGIAAKVICQNPSEEDLIYGMSSWFAKQAPIYLKRENA